MAGRRFRQRLMAGLESFENKLEELAEKLENKFPKSHSKFNEVFDPASLEEKYNGKTNKVSGVISESLLAKGFVFAAQIGSTVAAYKLISNGPVIRELKKETREINEKIEALLGDISRCNKVRRDCRMRLILFLKQSAAVAKN